jgi:hypothetical protein
VSFVLGISLVEVLTAPRAIAMIAPRQNVRAAISQVCARIAFNRQVASIAVDSCVQHARITWTQRMQ